MTSANPFFLDQSTVHTFAVVVIMYIATNFKLLFIKDKELLEDDTKIMPRVAEMLCYFAHVLMQGVHNLVQYNGMMYLRKMLSN